MHVGLLEVLEAGIRFKVQEAASPIWLRLLGDEREKEGLSPLKVQPFQRGAPPRPSAPSRPEAQAHVKHWGEPG